MSYHTIAYGKGVNQRAETRYVVLYKHTSGTNLNREFHLGPDGFREIYEGPSQTALMPGIWTQKLEVTTIWENPSELESVLSDIAGGGDGLYFMQVRDNLNTNQRFESPFYAILPEAISVADDAENVQATFVGTDGLAMLRDVEYNNAGNPYTDHQTIKQHIENVQSKHILFDVAQALGAQFPTAERLQIAESNISVEDELYSAYPPSTSSGTPKRMRVHHRTFHKQGQDGVNEYFSAYDVLESICLTLNLAVSIRDCYLVFWPVVTDYGSIEGRVYRWSGTEVALTATQDDYHFNGSYSPFTPVYTNIKGANWTRTFLPPAGDVRLIRNTQGDQGVIYATNLAPNTQLYDANDTYESGDQLVIRGSIRIQNENSYTFTGGDRLKRLIPTFVITLTDDNGDTIYYNNVLSTLNELAAHQLNSNSQGTPSIFTDNVNYTPGSVNVAAWSSDVGTYSYFNRSNTEQGYLHDANENFDFVVHFEFGLSRALPTSNGPFTDLTLLPKLLAYDSANNVDNTYSDSLTVRFVEVGAYRKANGEVQAVSKFTHRAHTDTGRTEINLGETLIGDRGAKTYFGGIEVYDGTDWVASSGWVNQEQSTPRTINQIVVEEVCAFHKRSKVLERGSLVSDGDYQYFQLGHGFKDVVTSSRYGMLSMTRVFTPALDEVVLVKVGRNMLDITAVQEGKDTSAVTTYAKPNNNDAIANVWNVGSNLGGISQSYHNEARVFFGQDWSSVIGAGETKEQYIIYNSNGQGEFTDHQGESPAAGTNIQRRIYRNGNARTGASDSGWSAIGSSAQPNAGVTLAGVIDLIHEYEAKNTSGRASYLITYSEVSTALLLDTYTEATAAYSLRKVRSDYVGTPIQARRGGDNLTAAIQFTSDGDLDTAQLLTFASAGGGNGNAYVRTWYDQAGSNDLLQTSISAQPQIVASGQVITVNSHPAVDFNGTSHYMDKASVTLNPSSNAVLTFAGVFQLDTVSSGQYIAAQWNGTTSNQVFGLLNLSAASLRFMARFQNGSLSRVNTGSGTTAADTQYIGVGQFKQNHSKGVLNDTDYTDTNVNSTVNHATSTFAIGRRPDTGANYTNGKVQEFCVWSQATNTHDRDALSDAIDGHYGTY